MFIERSSRQLLKLKNGNQSFVSKLNSIGNNHVRTFAAQPALDIEFPGIPEPVKTSEKPKPKTEVTTLPNGIRVASQETYQPNATLGVFIRAGSRYENDSNNGVSHMIEHMAFKSTKNRSHLRVVRDLEDMGANAGAQAGREHTVYFADVLRPHTASAMELLAETVLEPKMTAWDLEEQRRVMSFELEDLQNNPQPLLTESIHAKAFGDGSQLGRPMWCPARNLSKISPELIEQFRSDHFVAPRMIVSAAGVPHDELVKLSEKYFGNVPKTGPKEPVTESSKYFGGMDLIRADSPLTHVVLGFNVEGGWSSEDLLPVCVAHMLFGGGSSFSAGGPGKGMHSRLFTEVLNQHHWVESAVTFNSIYDDAGIFGMYGTSTPEHAGQLVEALSKQLLDVASSSPKDVETERAKNQLKSSIVMNLESRSILFEDIGRQMLTFGKREDPSDLCKRIDKITPEQVQKAVQKLLKSNPTFSAYGDVSNIPSYDKISSAFN